MLVGRDGEVARVEAFAGALSQGPAALVVRGEPGIGKTALWRHAVALSRTSGCRVLVTRPAEEEMALDLVGLVDLFDDFEVDLAALRLEDDAFARGRLVLEALRRLAMNGPIVVAVDDVQWLDPVSARALRYALRRLETEPVGVLATVRPGSQASDPLALSTSLPAERHDVLELGPLGLEDLRRVLTGAVASISRPTLRRIHEVSGGNPLYAIELARGLESDGVVVSPHGAVPLPDSLQAAIDRRLDHMPTQLTALLRTASALGTTSVKELRTTLPGVEVDRLIDEAEQSGLVLVEDDLEVRLSHPLVGSAVYARMSPIERRALHGRLAALAGDEDRRARHLALSTDEPDTRIATLLEDAAERARIRGASDLAAEFARHSVRLTPVDDQDAARRRAVAEIVDLAAAGEARRALLLVDRLVAALPRGPTRAEALVQRFYVGDDDLERGDELLEHALEDAGEDDLLRGRVLDILGWLRGMFRGDLRRGIVCARESVEIARRHGDAGLRMLATAHLAHMEALAGSPRPELMAEAVALAEEIGGPRLGGGPRAWQAKQLLWSGELEAARGLFEAALAEDVRSGNELERPYRLYDLALVECAAGRHSSSLELVDQGVEAARDAENSDAESWLAYPLALAEAWLGRADDARASARRLLKWERRRGGIPRSARARSVLGLLALSEDDARAAVRELTEADRLLERWGFAHPGALPVLPDLVEALAGAGEPGQAETVLGRLVEQAGALGHEWASAAVARSRGGLLVAGGDPEGAIEPLEGAASTFGRLGHGPDAARAVLALGRALLAAGQRGRAAEVLADARARFREMGAPLWEARASEELERAAPGSSGGRPTEVELRVASLVVRGLKNREIADALFMGVATVEAHLTRLYRKQGVRTRSELARMAADGLLEIADEAREGDPQGPR
jgi:DNA-binding CsgD family transcriptional regulator